MEPGFTYDIALEFALGTERLLPVVFMNALPGHPEDAIIFYGQSRSLVRFMVQGRGPDTMREFPGDAQEWREHGRRFGEALWRR